jgi:chitin synthase
MLAMTGVITATTKKHSLITLLQDIEYVHGQLFERTVESGCGAVTCLPGALTMLRFSAFRRMAKYYFADKAEQCEDLFDYGKCHLGEDRWLTHLFMIGAKKRYQIQMCTSAFCKTEAVQTYRSLIKQRRRWFLGFITNEVCMLTDLRIWRRYPILALVRFMQNTIRTTALLFFILVVSLVTTSKKVADLPVGFIAISLGLNWLMMIYLGIKLKRFKIWLYPLMFIVNPFFNWYYMVYGIFTAGQRTWGGPRADAGAADANTTPQQAIEKADDMGDDLNVVPETFKATADAHGSGSFPVPLQPPERLEGRFAAATQLPGGWYQQGCDSTATVNNTIPNRPHIPLHPRDSFDSFVSAQSGTNSVYTPRRVESIMGEEDRNKYAMAQANQRAAGGAYMTNLGHDETIDTPGVQIQNSQWQEPLGFYHERPTSQRVTGYNSVASSDGSQDTAPASPTEQTSTGYFALAVPQPVSGSRNSRNGRSPLGRISLVRSTSANQGSSIEMNEL